MHHLKDGEFSIIYKNILTAFRFSTESTCKTMKTKK